MHYHPELPPQPPQRKINIDETGFNKNFCYKNVKLCDLILQMYHLVYFQAGGRSSIILRDQQLLFVCFKDRCRIDSPRYL